MHWVFLTLAIIGEALGTSLMKFLVSDGYLVTGSLMAMASIAVSYTLLGKATAFLSVAFANATWECMGMVLIAAISFLFLKENISTTQLAGMVLSVIGIVIIHFGYQNNQSKRPA